MVNILGQQSTDNGQQLTICFYLIICILTADCRLLTANFPLSVFSFQFTSPRVYIPQLYSNRLL